jgi:hypothetical protein
MKCMLAILVLSAVVIVLLSFVYRDMSRSAYEGFPQDLKKAEGTESPCLFLYLFFHSHDCPTCLQIIQVLNALPSHFRITGVVPEDEFVNKKLIRQMTGVTFPLVSASPYKRFRSPITPVMLGVNKRGQVLFVLPAIPDQEDYLLDFLESFYYNRIIVGQDSYKAID